MLGVDLLALRVEAARTLTNRTGLADRVTYCVADATHLPVEDDALAQVWMLDVGIHVRDKKALFAELARVRRPGGLLVMHDQTGPLPPAIRPVTRTAPFIAPSLPQLMRYVEGVDLRVLRWQDTSTGVVEDFRAIKARLAPQVARTQDGERRRRSVWLTAVSDAYIHHAYGIELRGRCRFDDKTARTKLRTSPPDQIAHRLPSSKPTPASEPLSTSLAAASGRPQLRPSSTCRTVPERASL